MALTPLEYCWVRFKLSGCYVPVYNVCLNPVLISLATCKFLVLGIIHVRVSTFIIQQIVTLSKYGHGALDICHP